MLERVISYLRANGPELAGRLAVAALILAVGFYAAGVLSRRVERMAHRAKNPRVATLAPLARGAVFALVLGIGAAMALEKLGISITALVAGAGVLGLAVGFGAQTLVKDCISGLFLILDGVIAEGDVVSVDTLNGTVEKVGLRVTHVRAYDGQLWYVPNGEVKRVGNWNRGWARAVVEVGVAYEQELGRSLEALKKIGEEWAERHADIVLEPPEVHGILGLNGSDVTVRLVVKIDNTNNDRLPAERELRRRVKQVFDRDGIEIPFPRQVVYFRSDATADAAAASTTNGRSSHGDTPTA